jgi:hypothetical protein
LVDSSPASSHSHISGFDLAIQTLTHAALRTTLRDLALQTPASSAAALKCGCLPGLFLFLMPLFAILNQFQILKRDLRFAKELVSGVTRWRRRLDYVISELAGRTTESLEPEMRQVGTGGACPAS